VVHLEDAQGRLQFEILVHRTAARNAACQQLIGRVVRENEAIEVRSVARTRSSVLEPSIVGDAWLSDALGIPPGVAADLGAASAMIVPLVAGGTCFGTLALVSERHDHRFDESDVVFAEELGRRVAQGIEHARLYAEAQRALRMRDDVLAVVTHDLKNPLSSILMNAHQLLRAPGKADVPWLVKKASAVRRNAERMNRLIDDLVDVARIDTGRLSIELRPHGARALVAEIIATFEPMAADHAIDLVSASIPNLDLLCDRGRIFQVLSNLVGNALKFSADGREVVIRGEVHGALLELAVVDQGIGIPPDQIEHVFDRHWQAPEAVQRGTGLGLFIAKGIVEAHGGKIWADSTPGVGSTFHFTIPLAARTEERASAP
jgi:signal transduction histidine kinase